MPASVSPTTSELLDVCLEGSDHEGPGPVLAVLRDDTGWALRTSTTSGETALHTIRTRGERSVDLEVPVWESTTGTPFDTLAELAASCATPPPLERVDGRWATYRAEQLRVGAALAESRRVLDTAAMDLDTADELECYMCRSRGAFPPVDGLSGDVTVCGVCCGAGTLPANLEVTVTDLLSGRTACSLLGPAAVPATLDRGEEAAIESLRPGATRALVGFEELRLDYARWWDDLLSELGHSAAQLANDVEGPQLWCERGYAVGPAAELVVPVGVWSRRLTPFEAASGTWDPAAAATAELASILREPYGWDPELGGRHECTGQRLDDLGRVVGIDVRLVPGAGVDELIDDVRAAVGGAVSLGYSSIATGLWGPAVRPGTPSGGFGPPLAEAFSWAHTLMQARKRLLVGQR